jgi:hypothetical protein
MSHACCEGGWTPDRVAVLRREYEAGTELKEIGAKLGVDPEMAKRKAMRMKLRRPRKVLGEIAKMAKLTSPSGEALERGRDRPEGCCEWPMWGFGEKPTHHFCGKPRAQLEPDEEAANKARPVYCDEHRAKSHDPTQQRRPVKLPEAA